MHKDARLPFRKRFHAFPTLQESRERKNGQRQANLGNSSSGTTIDTCSLALALNAENAVRIDLPTNAISACKENDHRGHKSHLYYKSKLTM